MTAERRLAIATDGFRGTTSRLRVATEGFRPFTVGPTVIACIHTIALLDEPLTLALEDEPLTMSLIDEPFTLSLEDCN